MYIVCKEKKPGYIVGNTPAHVHSTEESAIGEATRLMNLPIDNEAVSFFVFKGVKRIKRADRPVEVTDVETYLENALLDNEALAVPKKSYGRHRDSDD